MAIKKFYLYCLCIGTSQLIYCMETPEIIEVVIQQDSPNSEPTENTEEKDSTPKETPRSKEIAKKAVRIALGSENEYLERMLQRRLDGEKSNPNIIPIHRIPEPKSREPLRAFLAAEAKKAQDASEELLKAHTSDAPFLDSSEKNQAVTKWVLNSVLDEKLQDRTIRENSDHWKRINLLLAVGATIVLPAITAVAQYLLTNHSCPDAGSN